MQKIRLDTEVHREKVSDSPNGLATYSDIHRCEEGILGISNLHIDHDFAIRSFSILELPALRKPFSDRVPGLPVPQADPKKQVNSYVITQMLDEKGFRLVIIDEGINAILNIGQVDVVTEGKVTTIISDLGMVFLDYYPSEMTFNKNLEKWLTILVNLLEILPPTRLGLFIETLRFIHGLYRTPPSNFHILQLKTILTCHETYFTINKVRARYKKIRDISSKYGEENAELIKSLLYYLEENPISPLQHFAKNFDRDLVYLIYLFLILEQEGLVDIERPGIVEEDTM
ncbi:MAG: hypothetical protein ACXAB7_24140 [Candidatus Kariarchaeaceae archaeon]|jgi:hypothetical protein